jgi:hypothetical protein
MEPLLTIQLLPAKRLELPPLDYEGSLLLRWQILLPERGVNPLQLQAGIEAEQDISVLGYLPRGQWSIPGSGNERKPPLAEISYTDLLSWFITTPAGFKNSQLLIYPYDQPTYQIPYAGTTLSFTPPPAAAESSDKDAVSTVTAIANQPIAVSAANPARLNGFVVNNTNKTIWVQFGGGAIGATSPAVPVVSNGGNVDIEQGYKGVIQAFIASPGAGTAALNGSIALHEFNAV